MQELFKLLYIFFYFSHIFFGFFTFNKCVWKVFFVSFLLLGKKISVTLLSLGVFCSFLAIICYVSTISFHRTKIRL